MKKFLLFVLVLFGALVLVGCKEKTPTDDDNGGKDNEQEFDKALSEQWNNFFVGKKIYLTTVGQSDVYVVIFMLESVGLTNGEDFTENDLLEASEVETGSVVIVVTGYSQKGVGGAGTNFEKEKQRANAFGTRAQNGEITVIALHIGGAERRGDGADPIIQAIAPKANLLLVYKEGNKDNLFTNISTQYQVELVLYSLPNKIVDAFRQLAGN